MLDLGRRTRFLTESQRAALVLRDRGCTAAGCDPPPALCQARRDHPWSHGGSTAVDTARLLCRHHHHRIHDPHYDVAHLPHGKVAFHRRT